MDENTDWLRSLRRLSATEALDWSQWLATHCPSLDTKSREVAEYCGVGTGHVRHAWPGALRVWGPLVWTLASVLALRVTEGESPTTRALGDWLTTGRPPTLSRSEEARLTSLERAAWLPTRSWTPLPLLLETDSREEAATLAGTVADQGAVALSIQHVDRTWRVYLVRGTTPVRTIQLLRHFSGTLAQARRQFDGVDYDIALFSRVEGVASGSLEAELATRLSAICVAGELPLFSKWSSPSKNEQSPEEGPGDGRSPGAEPGGDSLLGK